MGTFVNFTTTTTINSSVRHLWLKH